MKCRIIGCSLFSFLFFGLSAQESVPVNLIDLAVLTFDENPSIKRNQLRVKSAEGNFQFQKGIFDYRFYLSNSFVRSHENLFASDIRTSETSGRLNTNGMISSIGLTKLFRSGMSANLSANYNYISDNYTLNSFNETTAPYVKDHFLSSSLSLIQPLMQGRGSSVATALEQAASLNLKSNETNLVYANSFQILEFVIAYWGYLTAYRTAEIYQRNEERVRQLLNVTQDLVEGDKKPKGDLIQVKADLADQERLTNSAQQDLLEARLELGRSVGLSERESNKIGQPMDDYPTVDESRFLMLMSIEEFKDLARRNRKDIEASQLTKESLEMQLRLAGNNRKPQLDLSGTMRFGGMSMGNRLNDAFDTFSPEGREVSFEIGLLFEVPVRNNVARGAYMQSKASLEGQKILIDNLQRNIDLDVTVSVREIENTVRMLRKAEESFHYYQQAYENEQSKFQNGLTTLLNLIIFQERLTSAELEYLRARQRFAVAIINVRYVTGTLLLAERDVSRSPLFAKSIFRTIPTSN